MSNKTLIAPSILASDYSRLGEEIKAVSNAGADWIHFDVMDGCFVPPITFGAGIAGVAKRCTSLPLDVHLMVANPEAQVEQFAKAGADIITVHVEATAHLHRLVQKIHELGKKAGVALNPATPASAVENIISDVDMVLVMTVNPGWGGQKFISSMEEKIREVADIIKRTGKSIYLQVDGGINQETAKQVKAAGADVLVAGSYVFGSKDYAMQINSLR